MHIMTLRQKLQEAGGMIRTVRGVGYFLENAVEAPVLCEASESGR